MSDDGFTPVEQRIMALLADHAGHAPEEFRHCLADDLGSLSNLRPHFMRLRAKLRGRGLTVVCEVYPRVEYRLERVREGVPANG